MKLTKKETEALIDLIKRAHEKQKDEDKKKELSALNDKLYKHLKTLEG